MSEQEEREAAVREALSYERTNYHHEGRVKIKYNPDGTILDRGGVDCAQLPYLVYRKLGLVPAMEFEHYPPDWFFHRDEERYLNIVMQHSGEVEAPMMGDFALWKLGRCYAHGAIVLAWPEIIHASMEAGMVLRDRGDGGRLQNRKPRFFSLWRKPCP